MYGKSKANTLSDLMGHSLVQIRRVSADVALPLMHRFGTLAAMINELQQMGEEKARRDIANIKTWSRGGKRIGPKLAETIWRIFTGSF